MTFKIRRMKIFLTMPIWFIVSLFFSANIDYHKYRHSPNLNNFSFQSSTKISEIRGSVEAGFIDLEEEIKSLREDTKTINAVVKDVAEDLKSLEQDTVSINETVASHEDALMVMVQQSPKANVYVEAEDASDWYAVGDSFAQLVKTVTANSGQITALRRVTQKLQKSRLLLQS